MVTAQQKLAQVQPIAQIAQFSQLLNTVNQLNLDEKYHNHERNKKPRMIEGAFLFN